MSLPQFGNNVITQLRAMIEAAQQDLVERYETAWEDLKRRLVEQLQEEIRREAERRLGEICLVTPAIVFAGSGVALWRRRR